MIRRIRATWSDGARETEAQVLKEIEDLHLLLLDEVGVQHGGNAELVQLAEIIDLRYRANQQWSYPTAHLVNLRNTLAPEELIGCRRMAGGLWFLIGRAIEAQVRNDDLKGLTRTQANLQIVEQAWLYWLGNFEAPKLTHVLGWFRMANINTILDLIEPGFPEGIGSQSAACGLFRTSTDQWEGQS